MDTSRRILLIEDDANLLYGLQAKLRVEGFVTITDEGTNKNETIEKIKNLKPDYIILDIILPGVNGFDLLEEIKMNQEISQIPVFVFTNLSDEDSRQRSQKLGAVYYFIKSEFNLDGFVEKFKKIILNLEKI